MSNKDTTVTMTKSRVEKWLNEFKNTNTRKVYTWGLNGFFDVHSEADLVEKSEQYLNACQSGEKSLEDIKDDITTFIDRIETRKNGTLAPPKSIWSRVQTIKIFLEDQDVTIPKRWFAKLKNRRFKTVAAVHQDYLPSNIELRVVFGFMTPQGRALFGLLAASGCRIGEAMQLRVKDVILDHESLAPHVRFRAETTKTGKARLGFMTEEVKRNIRAWLSVRDEYLDRVARKTPSEYARPENDMRLFPFSGTTAYIIWKVAVRKAGLLEKDERTERYTLHPHVLRKWFRTRMGAVLTQDLVESLIGHSSYLSREYLRFSEQDLSDAYLKGQSVLLLNTKVVTKSELDIRNGEVESLKDEVARLAMLIREVANGKISQEWLKVESFKEPSKEEQERVLRELEEQIEEEEKAKRSKTKKRKKKEATK